MSDQGLQEITWHRDGHAFQLQLNRHEVVIVGTTCPKTDDRACKHEQVDCVVEWFLQRFGLDCNVGIAEPQGNMEIAWTLIGETWDIDSCQVWVIPVNDEAFAAWLTTQT